MTEVQQSPRQGRRARALGIMPVLLLVAMVVMFFVIPALKGTSPTDFNVYNALQDWSALSLLALALGITVIAGEFDLSVLAMYSLGAMVAVQTGTSSPVLGVVLAVAAAGLIGLVQGLIVAKLRINSMTVTLGGYLTVLGLVNIIGGNASVPYKNVNVGISLDDPILSFFSIRSLITIAIFAIVFLVLRYTVLGRNLRAMGGERRATRIAGVRADPLLVGCFVASAMLAALGGSLLGYSLATAIPDLGFGPLIFAITAVLLGGVALAGGRGSALGIAAGAFTLALLNELFGLMATPDYISDLITGGLLFIVTIISAPDLFGWWRSVRAAKVTTPEQEPVALEKS
ncbi:MAG: ABC transporter permease [Solirubrobacterales bacterium]|nr:ABC transporter permease [Solirubrobacterales bacterium]